MEESNFVLLWKEHYQKIDQSLAINRLIIKELINQKASNTLKGLIRLKQSGIIAFVIYLLLLGFLLTYAIRHYSPASNYFIISIGIIFLINVKGFADYIRHLIWTNNINYNGTVVEIQNQLLKLQLSIIRHGRIMCLQFPFFTTFFLSSKWFPQDVGTGYVILQVVLTGSFTFLSYWLYKQHKPENLRKKWFRKLIAGSGAGYVMRAQEFYREIEEFRQE
ncbi:MAG: hypothetical protein QM781_13515 [Chitinophagaceae bacterium]